VFSNHRGKGKVAKDKEITREGESKRVEREKCGLWSGIPQGSKEDHQTQ